MAKGDIVSDIQSIATGANLDYQPAAGVEALILGIGSSAYEGAAPNGTPKASGYLFDGAIYAVVLFHGEANTWMRGRPFLIDNITYLRVTNHSAGTESLSYWGIQTK